MVRRPHEETWSILREFLIANIDELSGWNTSFRRIFAKERSVFQSDDGSYYYNDREFGLVQVVGGSAFGGSPHRFHF